MSADDKTMEAVAKALHADACTQDDECSHFINEWSREARIAIEAYEAAKGEGGIPLVDQEAFREAFFETWTNANPVGAVATLEQAWSMVEAVLDNADLTPVPSESEREALADLADDIIDRANIEDVNPGSVAEVIEAVVTEHGFRRHPTPAPVVVETVEELEALRLDDDMVLQGHDNGPYVERALMTVRYHRQWRNWMIENGGFTPDQDIFPATVLTPATSATDVTS